MLKQSLFALVASVLVVFFIRELGYILFLIDGAHFFITEQLAKVFAGGQIGNIIRHAIALFIIPFLIALVPALIYWFATRTSFKYFPHILWVGWIILATLLVAK